ncbi:MAG: EamA family transporter RarD [Nevskiaceae bacterium]
MPSGFQSGFWAAVCAFLVWGVFPIYWKWLAQVPALQIMAHRLVWCFVLVAAWLTLRRGPSWWRPLVAQPRLLKLLSASAVLIALNWWLYIWAVNAGHIVETSLGYFINPLVNVLLGVAVLGERLNPRQWLAVAVAAAGVAWLTLQHGAPPWIALALAFSFGLYGLIRKVAVVESTPALGLESSILFLPAVAYLVWAQAAGAGSFFHTGVTVDALLVASGLVTALPLILFAYGAQRIPYSLVGILQYIAPSLQLACGVLLYGEPFSAVQAQGFACIWLALGIYAGDGLLRLRASRAAR